MFHSPAGLLLGACGGRGQEQAYRLPGLPGKKWRISTPCVLKPLCPSLGCSRPLGDSNDAVALFDKYLQLPWGPHSGLAAQLRSCAPTS